jgi:hypothetical protein
MIVYKTWHENQGKLVFIPVKCEGWFLFGTIPLYIKKYYI